MVHYSGIKTTTKLLFSVETHDSTGKRVQLYRFNCEMYFDFANVYSNDTHHSIYPSYNIGQNHALFFFFFFFLLHNSISSMTGAAQQAMRRTMEIYSKTTRFALACNASDKIIEPIQSRCAVLRYSRLSDSQILKRLLEICEAEGVEHTDDGLEAIIYTSQGDMRQVGCQVEADIIHGGPIKTERLISHNMWIQLLVSVDEVSPPEKIIMRDQQFWVL